MYFEAFVKQRYVFEKLLCLFFELYNLILQTLFYLI